MERVFARLPGKLLAAAVSLHDGLKVLAPPDMLLHSAAHLFQDGDLQRPVRELVDVDDLIRHFGAEPFFWDELRERASELDLGRPLYYALRYAHRYLGTPVSYEVLGTLRWRPRRPMEYFMDKLIGAVLSTQRSRSASLYQSMCLKILYARSHWLRMPVGLLLRHFTQKALGSWRAAGQRSIQPEVARVRPAHA